MGNNILMSRRNTYIRMGGERKNSKSAFLKPGVERKTTF